MKITRRQAREIALCLVFDFGFNSEEKPEELLDLYIRYFPEDGEKEITESIKDDAYISKVYFGVAENIDTLDNIIRNCSLKWKFNRISRISVSILRIAVYELLYMEDIPDEVSINEAVEMAKKYDTDESYTFVNGILGAVVTNKAEYQRPDGIGGETDESEAADEISECEKESESDCSSQKQ